MQQLPKKCTHIMGDFNVDLHKDTSCEVKEFESIMLTNGFLPLISIHTHEKPGCNKSCIDNVFTNSINDYITSATISESISHHLPIFSIFKGFDTEHKSNYQKKMINYDYCNSNVDMFVDQLSEKLNLNPPSDFCTFNKIYNDLLDKNFKLKTPRYSKRNYHNNPWITPGIIVAVNNRAWKKAQKKKCIYKSIRYRDYNNSFHVNTASINYILGVCDCYVCSDTHTKHDKFKSHRKNLKTIIETAKKKYNTGKILECNGDSKKVWQIINNVRGKQNKELKPNFVINNELIINCRIIANEFNKYFISLAPTLNEAYNSDFGISISGILDFKDYLPKSCDASIFLRDCNKEEVLELIKELKNGKSSDIPIHVIKKSASAMVSHLVKIFNQCLHQGIFPDGLKVGRITPIYKKDDECSLENYRPVSTLPIFGKIFEKIIYSRIDNFLTTNLVSAKATQLPTQLIIL